MSASSGVRVPLILTPPMYCTGGKRECMKPSNCMKKFRHKASLAQSGLSSSLCKHFETTQKRSPFLQQPEPIAFPQRRRPECSSRSQATESAEKSRTRIDLPAVHADSQDLSAVTSVPAHA